MLGPGVQVGRMQIKDYVILREKGINACAKSIHSGQTAQVDIG